METTTFTLECTLDTLEPLRNLEYQLKLIHGLKVFFVEPEDASAPVLISVSIHARGEQANLAIRRITHTLFGFVHNNVTNDQRAITLVTIDGQHFDLAALSSDEIKQIITAAHTTQI